MFLVSKLKVVLNLKLWPRAISNFQLANRLLTYKSSSCWATALDGIKCASPWRAEPIAAVGHDSKYPGQEGEGISRTN